MEEGLRFGCWTTKGETRIVNSKKQVLCVCDCGTERFIDSYKLRSGKTLSCGCKHGENISKSKTRHGMSNTRLHGIWLNITRRVKPTYHQSKYYYDKGITLCEEWKNFETFRDWALANGYSDELTIDRIDNSKGYAPNNCRWTTKNVQSNNRDNVYKTTYKGEVVTASELAERFNVSSFVCRKRIKKGMTGEEIRREIENGK